MGMFLQMEEQKAWGGVHGQGQCLGLLSSQVSSDSQCFSCTPGGYEVGTWWDANRQSTRLILRKPPASFHQAAA